MKQMNRLCMLVVVLLGLPMIIWQAGSHQKVSLAETMVVYIPKSEFLHTLYLPLIRQAPTKSFVLFGTPKFIADFDNPEPSINAFFDHYLPYVDGHPAEIILIFAVGNSEHILQYKGTAYWDEPVSWANLLNNETVWSDAELTYTQIHNIVLAFKAEAKNRGIAFKIYDQIDQAYEFTSTNFKTVRHREAMLPETPWKNYAGYEIANALHADNFVYATAPTGIAEGKNAGDFLAEQTAVYIHDLEFDGVLYGNQLGTRGHWHADGGPGYSDEEAQAILYFFQYSKQLLDTKDLMWFDSYNHLAIERDRYSVSIEAYQYLDYLMASGFCVITTSERYEANLASKITLSGVTRVLATLDYVDPWYDYDSMIDYPEESEHLEVVAIDNFHSIAGVVMFANDELGNFIPAEQVTDFAARFWGD